VNVHVEFQFCACLGCQFHDAKACL
jgi:hypothetical protein